MNENVKFVNYLSIGQACNTGKNADAFFYGTKQSGQDCGIYISICDMHTLIYIHIFTHLLCTHTHTHAHTHTHKHTHIHIHTHTHIHTYTHTYTHSTHTHTYFKSNMNNLNKRTDGPKI